MRVAPIPDYLPLADDLAYCKESKDFGTDNTDGSPLLPIQITHTVQYCRGVSVSKPDSLKRSSRISECLRYHLKIALEGGEITGGDCDQLLFLSSLILKGA